MPQMRTWEAMRTQIHGQLERRTGQDTGAWRTLITKAAPVDEPALRAWLDERGVTGHPLEAKSLGDDAITRRIALATVDDLDDVALGWLRRAYEESC